MSNMDESTKPDKQDISNGDSDLEQACSSERMSEKTDLSDIVVNEDNEKAFKSRSRRLTNVEDCYLSMNDMFDFPLLKENGISWISCTNFYGCNLCSCSIIGIDEAYVHLTEDFHKQNMNIKFKKNKHIQEIQDSVDCLKKSNQYFWCTRCKTSIEMNSTFISSHCLFHIYENLPESYQDIFQYSFVDQKHHLKCRLCDVVINNDKLLAEHLETPKHIQILDLLYHMNQIVKWSDLEMENVNKQSQLVSFNPKNNLQLMTAKDSSKNSYNNKPIDKPVIKNARTKLILYLNFFICPTCNCKRFGSPKTLQQHWKSSRHQKALGNIHLVMSDSVNNFVRPLDYTKFFLRLSVHSIWEPKPEKVLTKRSVLKEKNKLKKSKNVAYQEDVKTFGNQYISMCIENENKNANSIYRLNKSELRLLKLGISLIFTFNSHKVCIPCGYKFSHPLEFVFEHLQHENHLKNLREMEKNANKSHDKFTLMDIAKSCIGLENESSDYLKCFACETTIRDTDDDIEDHLKNSTHTSKMRLARDKKHMLDKIWNDILNEIWYYAERFSCELCNVNYEREISFAGHLNQPEHLEKVKNNESNCKFNICFACSTCWYGNSCHSEHYNKTGHTRFMNGFHLFVKQTVRKMIRNFDKTMNALIRESSSLNQEQDLLLLQSIEESVKFIYPNAKAYSFGSRFACLGSASSDVDVFLDCEGNYSEISNQEKSEGYIKNIVRHCLRRNKHVWKIDRVLSRTRVPIIKLEHRPTRLKSDISFLNGLGVEKSKLIRNYVMVDPICQHFMLFLKTWFQACKLYGSQGINGYAVTWFAIFYLQVRGLLPCVHQLITLKNESYTIDDWECGFSNVNVPERTFGKDSHTTLLSLVRGFFRYYANFKYRDEVACPFLGKVMKKKSFVLIDDLPPEMGTYKERIKKTETEHFRYDSPLAIQDPVDLSQNITKAVTKTQLRQFRYSCFISSKEIGSQK